MVEFREGPEVMRPLTGASPQARVFSIWAKIIGQHPFQSITSRACFRHAHIASALLSIIS